MYLVLEGIDGAGKTTQSRLLSNCLQRMAYTAINLIEPTYGPHGRKIRALFDADADLEVAAQRDLLTADRRWHIQHKIAPALQFMQDNPSFVVVQERCYLSAPAYQTETDEEMIDRLHEQQAFSPKPDLILLLDLPSDTAVQRLRERGSVYSKFEKDASVLEAVRQRYLCLASEGSERIVVVDAEQSTQDVTDRLLQIVSLKPVFT